MHLDPAPLSRSFSSLLTLATHRTVELALHPDGRTRHLDLQNAMRGLCAEARRQGMHAEDLIILFKTTWQARPELHRLSREETSRLLDAVVKMCVEEFYANGR